jgi:uncharacterized protein YegP (UPF0339 family)
MSAAFQIRQAKNRKYYFNLVAPNSEVILTSQMYASRVTAKKGIASVQNNAAIESRFEVKENKAGKQYFVLKAGNHQVIGTSESYSAKAALNKGIKAVTKHGPQAAVEDHT